MTAATTGDATGAEGTAPKPPRYIHCPTCGSWKFNLRSVERRARAPHGGRRKKGKPVPREDLELEARVDCILYVRLTAKERDHLKALQVAGGYTSSQALLRWLVRKGLYGL